jgi:hypothetical protein
MSMKRLSTWERKILTGVHGRAVEQVIWRVRTDQELRELYKDLDIVEDIKKKRLELIRGGEIREYLTVNGGEVEDREDLA